MGNLMDTITLVKMITKLLPLLASILAIIKESFANHENAAPIASALDKVQAHIETAANEIVAEAETSQPRHDAK